MTQNTVTTKTQKYATTKNEFPIKDRMQINKQITTRLCMQCMHIHTKDKIKIMQR